MLDIKYIRDNIDDVKDALAKTGFSFDDVELTVKQSERLVDALAKEANKLATALEKRGVVVF